MSDDMHPLRAARKAAHLSIEELARRAGLSARTVFRIEIREVSPHGSTRRVLAEALDLPVDDLFPEVAA